MTLPKEMAAGGAAGFCQTVVTTPMELLKIQLQLSSQQNKSLSAKSAPRPSALALTSHVLATQGDFLLLISPSFKMLCNNQ